MFVTHLFGPVFNHESRVLILGTAPSPKSRELRLYYGHLRSRFWPMMADIFKKPYPGATQEKIAFRHRNHVVVWGVLRSCEISGANDNNIENPMSSDMNEILSQALIQAVFATGTKTSTLYQEYYYPFTGIPIIEPPSTGPANYGTSYEKLREAYFVILNYL